MSLHNNEDEKESTLIIDLSKESALYIANDSLDDLKTSILEEFKKAKGIDKAIVGLNAAKIVSAKSFLEYGEEGYRIVISFKSKDPDVISHQIIKSMAKLTFSAYGAYTGIVLSGVLNLAPSGKLLSKIATPITSIIGSYLGGELGGFLADKTWELDNERKLRKYSSNNLKMMYIEDTHLVNVNSYTSSQHYKKPISDKMVSSPMTEISNKQAQFIIDQLGRSHTENTDEYKPPINRLNFTNKPIVDKNSNNDAIYLASSLYSLFNKPMLNIYTEPSPVSMANSVTDGFRVANTNLSDNPLDLSKYYFGKRASQPISLNRFSLIGYSSLPVDPLILDLNGDGAKVVSYNEKPVLFDIDNDGGSLEETGWVDARDGLLVRDLNEFEALRLNFAISTKTIFT